MTGRSGHKPAPEAEKGTVSAVLSFIEGMLVGVEMSRVLALEHMTARREEGELLLDIADIWGVAPPAPGIVRRVIVLRTADDRIRLVLGESAHLKRLSGEDVWPLPRFLEGFGPRAAIDRVFMVKPHLGYLLDVDRLAGWTSSGQRQ